jgi:L-alanine-DL-glutamate epimerase-like enolase superfamily enzyme
MKIIALETFLIEPRWLFLRMETDEGIVGWGGPVVEGRAHTAAHGHRWRPPVWRHEDGALAEW